MAREVLATMESSRFAVNEMLEYKLRVVFSYLQSKFPATTTSGKLRPRCKRLKPRVEPRNTDGTLYLMRLLLLLWPFTFKNKAWLTSNCLAHFQAHQCIILSPPQILGLHRMLRRDLPRAACTSEPPRPLEATVLQPHSLNTQVSPLPSHLAGCGIHIGNIQTAIIAGGAGGEGFSVHALSQLSALLASVPQTAVVPSRGAGPIAVSGPAQAGEASAGRGRQPPAQPRASTSGQFKRDVAEAMMQRLAGAVSAAPSKRAKVEGVGNVDDPERWRVAGGANPGRSPVRDPDFRQDPASEIEAAEAARGVENLAAGHYGGQLAGFGSQYVRRRCTEISLQFNPAQGADVQCSLKI